jgi:ankyrin repeat protein
VPTVPLPDQPSLEQLRNQAKDLQRAARAGTPDALAEVAEHHRAALAGSASLPLSAAHLVIARRYGFASWARLKRHVEIFERYSRFPAAMDETPAADLADTFLRLACLSYEYDEPERWAQARVLLAEHPGLASRSVHAAAAAADLTALRRIIGADRAAASREGGPYRWEPLVYLAYARHDPDIAEAAVLGAARLLLDAGADPNAGYLWHGLPTPFTVLTGVFGEGELGPEHQPRHPHSLALARLLLQVGADPNDGQTLYNRMFEPGNDHLELLLEFGLGAGDGGPWQARLGDQLSSPAEMLRGELTWAITHGMSERVELLVSHGVDVSAPFAGGVTPAEMAATSGHPELIDYLTAQGAAAPALDPADAFVAAVLAADRPQVARLQADHPELLATIRAARPALIVWAAALGQGGAVELLAELGFDVNARGRTDVPSDMPWQTALHKAAEDGNLDLARRLLALGADPSIHDARFNGTPLDWARYFHQDQLADLLEPLTAPGPAGQADG